MYRILKYPCGYDKNIGKWYAYAQQGSIIRTSQVEDETYRGYWVWILTDDTLPLEKVTFDWIVDRKKTNTNDRFLGLLEEQELLLCDEETSYVYEDFGFVRLATTKAYGDRTTTIIGLKTGQISGVHPQNLKYLGYATFHIKQEICVYFFEVLQ